MRGVRTPRDGIRSVRRRAASPVAVTAAAAALVLGILAALWGLGPVSAASASVDSGSPERGRVLIVAVPRLTWNEFAAFHPRRLEAFMSHAAVAMCSVRTTGPITDPGDAYLTIGAGNRAKSAPAIDGRQVDGQVIERSEVVAAGDPVELYQRNNGVVPTAPIFSMVMPSIDVANNGEHFGAVAGSLASSLKRSKHSMAVIGNADRLLGEPDFRHAGLAAMDERGQISDGMVSNSLLRREPRSAFGLELDRTVVSSQFDRLWRSNDVVLVELSDLERADAARATATASQGNLLYRRALTASDASFGDLIDRVDLRRDTVIVVAPTPPSAQTGLTVFAMAGPGVSGGWASSSTTRRTGYVTLTDIAPTVLSLQRTPVPTSMGNTRLTSEPSTESLADRVAFLREHSARAIVRDEVFGPFTVAFVVVLIIGLGLAMLCLSRVAGLAPLVRALSLLVLAVLPVSFLLGAVTITSPALLTLSLVAGGVVLAGLASLTRSIDPVLPPVLIIGLLWLVLAVDIATGGHLQIDTVFGYSPIVAGRFAGFGNVAFSLIAISSLLLATIVIERRSDPVGRLRPPGLACLIAWLAITVVLDGSPAMGSDVGGVLALVPASAVLVLLVMGIRLRARLVVTIGLATMAIIGVFAAIDMRRPPEAQTHLGRFVTTLFDGDGAEVIQRKLAANAKVLTSVWAWVIPLALVYFAYLTWRPNHTFRRLNRAHAQFPTFGVAGLTLGALSMAFNDSGVSLPAIMLALVVAYVSFLVMELERDPAPTAATTSTPAIGASEPKRVDVDL